MTDSTFFEIIDKTITDIMHGVITSYHTSYHLSYSLFIPQFPSLQSPAHLIDGIKTVGYEIQHLTWNNEFWVCHAIKYEQCLLAHDKLTPIIFQKSLVYWKENMQ